MFSGFSDWADGKIARLVANQSSRLGALLDPAVDRIYMVVVPVALAIHGSVPWWIVLTLIGRDVVLAATLPVLRSRGLTALPVTYIGKAATFALMSGLPLILLGQWDALWSRVILACGWAFLIWGLAMYLWSGVLYLIQVGMVMRPHAQGRAMSAAEEQMMTMSHLGGYDPEAGRSAHEADKPTLIPVPSLLRSLLSDHLDPGTRRRPTRNGRESTGSGGRRGRGRLPARWWSRWSSPPRSRRPGRRRPACARHSRCWPAASGRPRRPPTDVASATRRAGRRGGCRAAQPARGRRARAAAARPTGCGELRRGRHPGDRAGPGDHRHGPGNVRRPQRRVQAARGGQPAGDPRPRSAAGGQLAVGQWRRGHLGRAASASDPT